MNSTARHLQNRNLYMWGLYSLNMAKNWKADQPLLENLGCEHASGRSGDKHEESDV